MLNHDERPSYEAARSEDDVTAVDDEDLPLSSEELSLADPLDQGSEGGMYQMESSAKSTFSLAAKLRQWRDRTSMPTTPITPDEDVSAEASLLPHANGEQVEVERPRWALDRDQTVGWMIWILPSFTHHFFVKASGKEEIRRPTDYLDGMRGVASLFVFFGHYIKDLYAGFIQHGYGEEDHWSIFELPFIKTVYAGSAMVAIFFVISGYVLSQRCVISMRAGKHEKLYNDLTSLTFRRAIRLFLPSIAISFFTLIISLIGILPPPAEDWRLYGECHRYWMYLMENLFKLWTWKINYQGWYAHQLWTIPLEYRCSLVLFLFILMTSRCKVHVRFGMEAVTILYLFYRQRWDVALFIWGMVLAEVNIVFDERKKAREAVNLDEKPVVSRPRSRLRKILRDGSLWIVFLSGIYISGYPSDDADKTPGYITLSQAWEDDYKYKWRFWLAIAAILVVSATSFLPAAQKIFTTSIARYLGKISYALYLVHEIMNRTLRLFLWNTFWKVLKYESEVGDDAKYEGGWIIGTIIYVPLVIWVADVFWRAVDLPTVRFAKYIESKCFKSGKQA